jgi:hypothetical protein
MTEMGLLADRLLPHPTGMTPSLTILTHRMLVNAVSLLQAKISILKAKYHV